MPAHNIERVRYVRQQQRLNAAQQPRRLPDPVRINPFHDRCIHCRTPLMEKESSSLCCGSGKYVLGPHHFPHIPDQLLPLYHDPRNRHYLRKLNTLFSMASYGVPGDGRIDNINVFPAYLKLMGGMYHSILPRNKERSALTWVIYDSAERTEAGSDWRVPNELIQLVRTVLYQINPYARHLRALGEALHTARDVSLVMKFPPNQTTHEVAAVFDYTGQTSARDRDITFYWRDDDDMHFIQATHPAYMPLAYPLLYPFGNFGYDHAKKDTYSVGPMTMLRYYRQIYLRSPLFALGGRLFQQHLLDAYTTIEDENLDFIKKTVNGRIARRRELHESIEAGGGPRAGRIYLPASFSRGKRHRAKLIDDGMAVVSRYGKPTYFITITCNPEWPEIREALIGNTSPHDNPLVVARVFHSKFLKIMDYIKRSFGGVVYYMWVIEFQKRGLPHAHIALCTENGPQTSREIDAKICATMPEDRTSRLYELVHMHMRHECKPGRCLDENGNCVKTFPKEPTAETHLDERGFPKYRRITREDQYVVPYNPELLCYVNAHVNIELASYVNVIRYLYKYIYKQPDSTPYRFDDDSIIDEIAEYKKGRYLSASEAAWRLCGFHTQSREPAVQMVPVHLPGYDNIMFYEGREHAALDNSVSDLNRYFARPYGEAYDNLTYTQYYEKFNVQSKCPPTVHNPDRDHPSSGTTFCVWPKRDTSTVVRMQHLLPTQGDVWYLRVLLRTIPARAASDYLTIYNNNPGDGPAFMQCNSFQEAAVARGLVSGDMEGLFTFHEAMETGRNHPRGLRSLFVMMVFHGFHMQPVLARYHQEMSFDYVDRRATAPQIYNRLLLDLNRRLTTLGKTMADYGLPQPEDATTELDKDRLAFPVAEQQVLYTRLESMCTHEQRQVVSRVMQAVIQGSPLLLFLQAPAGHGKSHVFKTVAAGCRAHGRIAVTMATTGLASLNFEGGKTLHSTFRMSVVEDPTEEQITCDVSARSQRAEYLRSAGVFLLDEAIMGHREWFDAMDRTLRDLCQSQLPFAGKVVVFAGDFRQLPTIVKGGSDLDIYRASIAGYPSWQNFEVVQLTIPLRDIEDQEWSAMVKAVGDDALPRDEESMIALPLLTGTTNVDEALQSIYPDDILDVPLEAAKRAILCGTNAVVDEINDALLQRLPGAQRIYYSHDENAAVEEATGYNPLSSIDVLNSINSPNIPPHKLTLRVGAVCFIERNLSAVDGLMHNCKVEILGLFSRFVEVKVLTGPATGNLAQIPRIIFEYTWTRTGIKLRRRQFPLRLSYSMTYNKSQGQTLDRVVLDLRNPPFAHGQLYVGISRVRARFFAHAILASDDLISPFVRCVNVVNRFFMSTLRRIERD